MKLIVLLALCCCSLRGLLAQEGEVEGEGTAVVQIPPCAISLVKLENATRELFPAGFNTVINCLSFNENGELSTGIVSGSNATLGMRLILRCVEGLIVPMETFEPALDADYNRVPCLECIDATSGTDICRGGMKEKMLHD